jgi:hypothetical protein
LCQFERRVFVFTRKFLREREEEREEKEGGGGGEMARQARGEDERMGKSKGKNRTEKRYRLGQQ